MDKAYIVRIFEGDKQYFVGVDSSEKYIQSETPYFFRFQVDGELAINSFAQTIKFDYAEVTEVFH